MKLFRSALLILGETAALGWFLLRDIPFTALLPLIPLGLLFYHLHHLDAEKAVWLNGFSAFASMVAAAVVASIGVFDSKGLFPLLCLLPAIGLIGFGMSKGELERVAGWWVAAFLLVFAAMLIASVPGARLREGLPETGDWADIFIFYLLAVIEPLSLGKEFRAAPLALGILLVPFAFVSYLALGDGAFALAEFPYLSVWAGVAISAFHHTEGIILCLYYGMAAFRLAYFFAEFGKKHCNESKIIV